MYTNQLKDCETYKYWGKRQIYYVIVVIYKHAGETFRSHWIKDDKHTSFRTSGMTTFLNAYLTKLDLCKCQRRPPDEAERAWAKLNRHMGSGVGLIQISTLSCTAMWPGASLGKMSHFSTSLTVGPLLRGFSGEGVFGMMCIPTPSPLQTTH